MRPFPTASRRDLASIQLPGNGVVAGYAGRLQIADDWVEPALAALVGCCVQIS